MGLLSAGLLSALVVWRAAPRELGPALAIMTLLVPGWLTLVDLSWTASAARPRLMFLAAERGHATLAALALLAALATKQHVLLLCPVLAVWPKVGGCRVIAALVGSGLVALPWLVADPQALLKGAPL